MLCATVAWLSNPMFLVAWTTPGTLNTNWLTAFGQSFGIWLLQKVLGKHADGIVKTLGTATLDSEFRQRLATHRQVVIQSRSAPSRIENDFHSNAFDGGEMMSDNDNVIDATEIELLDMVPEDE